MGKAQTSVAFERVAGKLADGVAYKLHGGTGLRARPTYKYPVRPAVSEGNARMREANRLFNTMTEAQADAWTRYGEAHPRRDPMSGTRYAPAAKNIFSGLTCKLLQVDTDAEVPLLPPTGSFVGDGVRVVVEPGASLLAFAASGPNRPGVLTELMIQPLKNVRCKPQKFYKSHGFIHFEEGSLVAVVPVEPGVYACMIQFVERATGRVAGKVPLGKIEVVA